MTPEASSPESSNPYPDACVGDPEPSLPLQQQRAVNIEVTFRVQNTYRLFCAAWNFDTPFRFSGLSTFTSRGSTE